MKAVGLRDDLAALSIDRSKRRGPSRAWAVLGGLALLAVVAGIGFGGYLFWQERFNPPPTVKTETVRIMTLGQANTVLTATGYLESRLQAAVGAKSPGRIKTIPVEEGAQVKQGDLLAELEHSDLDAVLASRQVAVEQAEATLVETENHMAQAERDFARERDVFEQNAGTRAAFEKAETAFKAYKALYRARQAALAAAKAGVVEAQEGIKNMYVYAPFDGTVITKDAEQGETIMPGGMGAASGRGSVVTLANLRELEVDTDVKEDYLGQIHKGQAAEVVVDAVPQRRYRGKLREIIPMGDRTRGIVKVKVTVLDPDERLFPELSATVHFLPDSTGEKSPASEKGIFAPQQAIVKSGEETFVWCLEGEIVRKVSVEVGPEVKGGLVRIEKGLSGGEAVVVDPPAGLTEGTRVTLPK